MTSTNGGDTRHGFHLVGEFLSIKPGKEWTDREGGKRRPFLLSVLHGERVVRVEFSDEDSAQAAAGDADKGAEVALPVFVRAKGKDWLQVAGLNLRSA